MFCSDTDGLKPYGAHIDIETRNGKVPLQIFGDGRHLYVSTTRIGHPFNQRMTPANILWGLGDGNVRFDSEAARAELMGGDIASIQRADELEAERNATIAKIAVGAATGAIALIGAAFIATKALSRRK